MIETVIIVLVIAAIVAACVKKSPDSIPPAPTILRQDLKFAYFGAPLAEVKDHVNLHFAGTWFGQDAQLREVVEAKAAGIPVMLDVANQIAFSAGLLDPENTAIRTRERFQTLKDSGCLDAVTYLYYDEPDRQGMAALQVQAINQALRTVAAEFSISPRIATFYSAAFTWVGAEYFDDIGFDNYGKPIFSNGDFQRLKRVAGPTQKIMLIAGGADPWRDDPVGYFNAAEQDSQVSALFAFAWPSGAEAGITDGWGAGIRSNGLAMQYREIGLKIKQ